MAARRLSDADIQEKSAGLTGWTVVDGKLHKEFLFDTFVTAFGFMAQLALVSESLNHHPEWFNVYNRVTVDLTTHDAGGISDLDFQWAERADAVSG